MHLRSGINGSFGSPGAGVPKAFVRALFARSTTPPTLTPAAKKSIVQTPMGGAPRPASSLDHPLRLEPPSGVRSPSARIALRSRFLSRRTDSELPDALVAPAKKEAALRSLVEAHLSTLQQVRTALAEAGRR
jgi:hypothetical protein